MNSFFHDSNQSLENNNFFSVMWNNLFLNLFSIHIMLVQNTRFKYVVTICPHKLCCGISAHFGDNLLFSRIYQYIILLWNVWSYFAVCVLGSPSTSEFNLFDDLLWNGTNVQKKFSVFNAMKILIMTWLSNNTRKPRYDNQNQMVNGNHVLRIISMSKTECA